MDPIDSGQGQENPSEQNSDLTPSSRGRQRKKNPKYQDYETEDPLDEKKTTGRKSSGEGAASKRTPAKWRKAENDPEPPENDVENEANHKTPQEPDEIKAKETPKKVVRAKKTPTKRTPGRKKKNETPNTDVALPHLEGGVADSAQQENGTPKPKRKYVKKQRAQVIAEPPPCAALSEPEEEIQPGGRRRRGAAKAALKYLHNLAKEALAHPGDETASQLGADSDEPNPKEKGKRLKGSKDVQQLLVSKEELPPEQQEWSHILDQEDTKPQHIKEEHEELWISQEEEQLQGLEEADTTKFPFTPVSVKSEDDEEKPQSSQLHQRQTEQMETGVGEDCGGAEPERDSDPERRLQPETEVETEDSYESETDDSDDWQETGEHLSEFNLKNKKLKTCKRPHSCLECGKRFNRKGNLTTHMLVHKGEKPFSCSVCSKRFTQRQSLTYHMLIHTGEKAFSCSVCSKSFTQRQQLTTHMLVHTGEKDFSCSACSKSFTQRGSLTTHMLVHTGEKPFSCSVCSKSFTQRGSLTTHMLVHTGEKPFSCSVCSKRFTQRQHMTTHMLVHTGEKPFSCSECGKRFSSKGHMTRHMMIHTGEKC